MTTESIRITTLVENTAGVPGLLGEHGLAFWLEMGSRRILFDTGAGAVLSANASTLGINVAQTDTVVLSHGHYDHTGGLATVLREIPRAKVFAHPAAFDAKFVRLKDGTRRYIGIPPSANETVRRHPGKLTLVTQPTEIGEGVFITGEIPRVADFEDTGGPFFTDEQCEQPDPLIDDQALFFEASQGTVVILGCAHAGLINTLHHVHQLTAGKPIHAVAGGMHLISATEERINRTIDSLREFGVDRLAPAHCTGMAATAALWAAFPGKCVPCAAGARLEFQV